MNKNETLAILEEIYKSNYTGSIIVQDYIHGGQGTEYSLNGYRAHDGKVSMVLARNLLSVSYTHLTLPTTLHECRSRWSPYH